MGPLCGDPHGVPPRIGRVVERGGVYDGPVQEIAARVVRIAVVIEDINDGELADRQDHVVGRLCSPELVGARAQRAGLAAKVEALAYEGAGQAEVRLCFANLVRFAAGEAGKAQRIVKTEPFVDLRVDIEGPSIPKPNTQK